MYDGDLLGAKAVFIAYEIYFFRGRFTDYFKHATGQQFIIGENIGLILFEFDQVVVSDVMDQVAYYND